MMRRRKDDLVKPENISLQTWLFRLECDRADLNRQVRREIHTRGFVHGRRAERLDRAVAFARAELACVFSSKDGSANSPDQLVTTQGPQT